jgi:hypothetical protein
MIVFDPFFFFVYLLPCFYIFSDLAARKLLFIDNKE